jgi:CRISPR-associated endonuclease Cas2
MKKGELVKKVVLAASAGVAIGAVMVVPPLAITFQAIMEAIEKREGEKPNRKQARKVLYNLKKRKLVSLKEVDGELWVTFNEEGKKLFLKYRLDELKISKPRKWDKKWRIVIFDIPEKKKVAREVLRDKLNQLGFFQLQKSVFVYPFECQREIELISRFYGIEPYVYFIRADYIDNEEKIREKFGLA